MSLEMNKLHHKMNEFLEEKNPQNEEELKKCLDEFMGKYNSDLLDIEDTPSVKALEKLEEAYDCEDEKEAKKLAKEALKIDPFCVDAKRFLFNFEENPFKLLEKLDKAIKEEEEHLKEEDLFNDENIGMFYGLFETRPYIILICYKLNLLLNLGMLSQAKEVALEIIRLNENDNMGARFVLMAIYTYFEDEKALNDLLKEYPDDTLISSASQMILNYKLGNFDKALKYLKEANKRNKHFIKVMTKEIKEEEFFTFLENGMYSLGDKSEVFEFMSTFRFVLLNTGSIGEWIDRNKKKVD